MGYTKLFTEIIMSTVWREPNHVRLLWITMLALKDRWHIVNASIPGLADSARITMDECISGIKILSSPDPYSRTKDNEGRRIIECDGGWEILNGEKYRNKMCLDERREYNRIKQKEYRARNKSVKSCVQSSTQCTHTDTDTDTKAGKVKRVGGKKVRYRFTPPTKTQVISYAKEKGIILDADDFCEFYASKGWMVGKNKMKCWKSAASRWARKNRGADNGKRNNQSEADKYLEQQAAEVFN